MTAQHRPAGAMKDERHRAVGAPDGAAAVLAEKAPLLSALVEEEDRLLGPGDAFFQRVRERPGQQLSGRRLCAIDDLDGWRAPAVRAGRESVNGELAFLGAS